MTAGFRRLDVASPRTILRRASAMRYDVREGPSTSALQLVSLGDGRHVLVLAAARLFVCDLDASTVLQRSPEPAGLHVWAFGPSGATAICVQRARIDIFDTARLAHPARSLAWTGTPRSATAHPDGRRLAISEGDHVDVLDLASGARLVRIVSGVVTDLVADARGVYAMESTIYMPKIFGWTWEGAPLGTVAYGRGLSVDAGRILTHDAGNLLVRSAGATRARMYDPGPRFGCSDFAMLGASRAVTIDTECAMTLWDLDSGLTITGTDADRRPFAYPTAVGLSASRFALATTGNNLELWEVAGDDDAPVPDASLGYYEAIGVGDGAVLARGLRGGARIVDLATGATHVPDLPADVKARYVIDDDDRVLLWNSGEIGRLDRRTGERTGGVAEDGGFAEDSAIAIARGGELAAGVIYAEVPLVVDESVPEDERPDHSDEFEPVFGLFDPANPEAFRRLVAGVPAYAFAGPAGEVLVGALGGEVVAWRTSDGSVLARFPSPPCEYLVASDRGWFATLDGVHRARTFDLTTGAQVAELAGEIAELAVGRDGAELVTATASGDIAAWDPRTGARLAAFAAGPEGFARSLIATRAGHLAWIDAAGTLRRLVRE